MRPRQLPGPHLALTHFSSTVGNPKDEPVWEEAPQQEGAANAAAPVRRPAVSGVNEKGGGSSHSRVVKPSRHTRNTSVVALIERIRP